jgi:hypothetical protein
LFRELLQQTLGAGDFIVRGTETTLTKSPPPLAALLLWMDGARVAHA